MWTRAELKSQAKSVLKVTYWESVVAYLIIMAISITASLIISIIPVINFFGSLAFTFFVTLPLMVGFNFFMLQNRLAPPQMNNLFYAFSSDRYMKIVGRMAWQSLFIYLWSLIPISGGVIFAVKVTVSSIPSFMSDSQFIWDPSWTVFAVFCGIIYVAGLILVVMKQISYSMTGYILTDNPHIEYDRALKLSIAMTHGQKWNIFVLELSFIGWMLLSFITLFIGYVFLVPYIMATYAELYVRLRDAAVASGLTTAQELNLMPAPGTPSDSGASHWGTNVPYSGFNVQQGSLSAPPYAAESTPYEAPRATPAAPQSPETTNAPKIEAAEVTSPETPAETPSAPDAAPSDDPKDAQ